MKKFIKKKLTKRDAKINKEKNLKDYEKIIKREIVVIYIYEENSSGKTAK